MHDVSLAGLTALIRSLPEVRILSERIAALSANDAAAGPLDVPAAAQTAVAAALADGPALSGRPMVWLVAQPDEARAVADGLRAFLRTPERVVVFPAPDVLPYERHAWDPTVRGARLSTLAALARWRRPEGASGAAPIVVAPVRGALTCTLQPKVLEAAALHLQVGQRVAQTSFVRHLLQLGYERVDRATEPGQTAQRGGIVDFFTPDGDAPVRAEWFGDEIDSLRSFDPQDQRSREVLSSVVVLPAGEVLLSSAQDAADAIRSLSNERLHPLAESEVLRHADRLARGERFGGIEAYASWLNPERSTLFDHLPSDSLLLFDTPTAVFTAAEGFAAQTETVRRELIDAREMPPDWPPAAIMDPSGLRTAASSLPGLILGRDPEYASSVAGSEERPEGALSNLFGTPERFGGQIEAAVLELAGRVQQGGSVVVVSRQAPRIAELFAEIGLDGAPASSLNTVPGPGGLALVHGALPAGWTLTSPPRSLEPVGSAAARDATPRAVELVTDGELFGWRMSHRRRRTPAAADAEPHDYFSELSPGDYAVHIEHGIGLFRGIKRMETAGTSRDYLQLEYSHGDVLYVPTHQADRVARYVGTGDVEPAVTRLGTADWDRAKARAKREVEDIAEDLLALYARRETARRAAFMPDTAWQTEMEAGFPYVETDDQVRAIEAVKRDMEGERPMDRLVVGDVGFGKTEVALRAAFKAVMGGRQVAVLAPTTVLAQQHHDTFEQRLRAFPVTVDLLSRFRNRTQQAQTLERVARGEIDVLVGTHRLLQPDVRFKDLGLLIVDEEQRFGVKHKERLREIAEGVDTLTLTATPIPRTLHLALTGLRDLTKIDSPPVERQPVETHFGTYDEQVVRQAVRRELARRGQVFYVFNRVRGIQMVAQKVRRLAPEAVVEIAHGQMREGELARTMLAFVAGAIDVLVCTSIIESGLDIPNANTLIVERADLFGLAQLHQLRGRVGRSAQRAFAYFMVSPGAELSDDARDRLEGLADHADLGAGFRIAMRDLEIRGAGEILGARQHGQVASIGLDLYTRLLAEAMKRVRADTTEDPKTSSPESALSSPAVPEAVERELAGIDPGNLPTVDLPLDAYLPEEYVHETSERTRLYRRLAGMTERDQVQDMHKELRDRFGPPPVEVTNLLAVVRLRVLAHRAGAQSVGLEGDAVAVWWPADHRLDRRGVRTALPSSAVVGNHRIGIPIRALRAASAAAATRSSSDPTGAGARSDIPARGPSNDEPGAWLAVLEHWLARLASRMEAQATAGPKSEVKTEVKTATGTARGPATAPGARADHKR